MIPTNLGELVTDSTRIAAGDELWLEFVDDPPWLQLDVWKADAQEFAADLLRELQGKTLDVGTEPLELVLLVQEAHGFYRDDEDGDQVVGAMVRAVVTDLRPKPEQVQQASIGTGLKLAATLAVVVFGIWAIKPVFVEARRVVRGFTDDERKGASAGPSIGTTAIVLGLALAVVALVYLSKQRSAAR